MAKTKGNVSSGRTTARGGTTKKGLGKVKAHLARSESGGRSNNSTGRAGSLSGPPTARRTRRGPGAGPKEVGRSQSAQGHGRGTGGPAPKRAK